MLVSDKNIQKARSLYEWKLLILSILTEVWLSFFVCSLCFMKFYIVCMSENMKIQIWNLEEKPENRCVSVYILVGN